MRTLAAVFCYNRGDTLEKCVETLFTASSYIPDQVVFVDDGSSDPAVHEALKSAKTKYSDRADIVMWIKGANIGLSDSAQRVFDYAKQEDPDYLLLIEGDYVYRSRGIDDLMDLFRNTSQGRNCLAVAGYDQPHFYNPQVQATIFPDCMIKQVGEDNVNRAALYKPFWSPNAKYAIELVSNTCWTSYLHWRNIQKVGREFPELWDLLDQAIWPRENPNYPTSGEYKAARVVDDGMLSHALSLTWNNWALAHNFDRTQHAAWLNIKPSIAQHVYAGGMHS
jgi:glycosyltransferase involved in cell wall biosynthesis